MTFLCRGSAMRGSVRTTRSRPGRSTLVAGVAERLRHEIVSGLRPAGAKLGEPSLAVEQGVSRGPVREALRQLEREGLVVFDAVGRSRVVTMSDADFEDISMVRVALESAAAAHVAVRFDARLRRSLDGNITAMTTAATLADISRLDLAFHDAIMEASGRRRLIATWRSIHSQLALWLGSLHRAREAITADVLAVTLRSHRDLVEVLAAGDAARASAAAAEHAGGLVRWVPRPAASDAGADA
jgi:DNA-binding GntR family transcriptional regulator